MSEKKLITREEFENLNNKLDQLLKVDLPKVKEDLVLARSQGDLSENADYSAAREHQSQIEGQIAEITDYLRNATVLVPSNSKKDSNKVALGDTVKIKEISTGEKVSVKIFGSLDAVAEDALGESIAISGDSPLGTAITGQTLGSVVVVPASEPYDVVIEDIEKAK